MPPSNSYSSGPRDDAHEFVSDAQSEQHEDSDQQTVVEKRVGKMTYDQVQMLRYTQLSGKGGDGDPAYARDASLLFTSGRRHRSVDEHGRYAREGD